MYTTYILKSLKDGTYYYGSTSDLDKRLKQHNWGKTPYTKGGRPLIIHYKEIFSSKQEAINRELFFKSIDSVNYFQKSTPGSRWENKFRNRFAFLSGKNLKMLVN